MVKVKLAKAGNSIYVRLSSDWLHDHNLGKGSLVNVLEQKDGSILISTLEGDSVES